MKISIIFSPGAWINSSWPPWRPANGWRPITTFFITGPIGVGKTYLACALAQKACREGYALLYRRLPRLLMEIAIVRGDGNYHKLMEKLAKADLLVIDDWGLAELAGEQKQDLLELMEDRLDCVQP